MKSILLFLLFTMGCTAPAKPPEDAEPAARKPGGAEAGLPAGFVVAGEPLVEEAFLDPAASWRDLRSRVTRLQAEAVARAVDILLTFEARIVHATTRDGARRSWRQPEGLVLEGVPKHLLLKASGEVLLYAADHSQVVLGDEVTVVTARMDGGGEEAEFRLLIKGGTTFRSISTAG